MNDRKFNAGLLFTTIVGCLLFLNFSLVNAQGTERYPEGAEGIKAAYLPPPGFYWVSYNLWYSATTLRDLNGNALPVGFDVKVLGTVQRLVWMTDATIFGANYGVSVIIPFLNTHLKVAEAGLDNNETGFGDIVFDQCLRWARPSYEVGFGFAVFFPTGARDIAKPALPGKDYYTFMPTLGMIYYLDKERLWAVSVLTHFEFQGPKRHIDLTPGDAFHFEWGLSDAVAPFWEVGLVGYCQWQVTADKGSAAERPAVLDRVFAVGPEVDYFLAPAGLVIKFRYETELGAVDRPQGDLGVLTLVKIF